METNIASPSYASDSRSKSLVLHLQSLEQSSQIISGVVYYDFPLFRDPDDVLYRSKVLLASRSHGLLVFSVDGMGDRACTPATLRELDAELAQLHSIILGKLVKSKRLRRSVGTLTFPLESVLFLPDLSSAPAYANELETRLATSLRTVTGILDEQRMDAPMSEDAWHELRSILEGAKGLVRPRERSLANAPQNGKAVLLAQLEAEIANFDADQRRAAISIVEGPQRIRGLAGSGKTIVLAMKAAHLHLNNPAANILYTFHTKSLYDFIKRLITRFYRQFNDRDPDWSKIHILHAWGGSSVGGVYYNASLRAGVPPLGLREANTKAPADPFDYAIAQLLRTNKVTAQYDYVLMDEAQDFPSSFFRLCFYICRGGPQNRNLVWAYDELQNIMSVRVKTPIESFGTDDNGKPLVDLTLAMEQSPLGFLHDIVLHKCYRNPREVLVCAHALGFGIYSDTVVQMLENSDHWRDVGYEVERGGQPGEKTVIFRPRENSPLSISDNQTPDQLIQTHVAEHFLAEASWVSQAIQALIAEGLRADDILVIALDDRNARGYFQAISEQLADAGIPVNNILADPYGRPAFSVEGEVTLSTVYRAKGNEAAVVFAVGIDALHPTRKLQRGRNKLFTAFTRAKGWLRVSGIGAGASFFVNELATAMAKVPRMEFVYPDPRKIVTLQRDLTDKAAKLRRLKDYVDQQLEMMDVEPEDREVFAAAMKKNKK